MKREIEFRAWCSGHDSYNNQINGWVYGNSFDLLECYNDTFPDSVDIVKFKLIAYTKPTLCYQYYICIADTLGQYTGVDDKNGKRIYEGDIVTIHDPFCKEPHIGEVEFSKGSFGVRYTVYKDWENFWPLSKTMTVYEDMGCRYEKEVSFEVIGNTYENPELLTKSENK